MHAAVFLDRDGVINENKADYVKGWEEFTFLPGVFEALRRLAENDLTIVVASNQSAVGRGLVSRAELEKINQRMVERIHREGGRIDAVLYCPHRPEENCPCRKPQPGLLLQAAERFDLDLTRSYAIGDALCDIAAGLAAGCCPILVLTGLGRQELVCLKAQGYDGYRVARDLREAVEWILDNHR